jgi:hypothetical protein
MRTLVQLGEISRELRDRVCEWEGSTNMSTNDILSLLPYLSEGTSLLDTSGWGQLPEYAMKKMEWLLKEGLHREALHTM